MDINRRQIHGVSRPFPYNNRHIGNRKCKWRPTKLKANKLLLDFLVYKLDKQTLSPSLSTSNQNQ